MEISSLHIHSSPQLSQYFYNDKVREVVKLLQQFLGKKHNLHLFPEATIKKNKLPNGILVKSEINDTVLMPSLLRDPGCGFFLFKINQVERKELSLISQHIMAFCQQLENTFTTHQEPVIEALRYGTSFLNNDEFSSSRFFPVDLDCLYYDINFEALSADLSQITNSLELKISPKTDDSNANLIGFIHTGSDYFSTLLENRWFKIAADYSYINQLSSIADIKNGFYGLHDSSGEAEEYQHWIRAAMNYCNFKRWWLFCQLKSYLMERIKVEIYMINDRCHAGLFTIEDATKRYLIQARGVQLIDENLTPYLIAGHRESNAYLVNAPARNCQLKYLGHGTSYKKEETFDYTKLLGIQQSNHYLEQLNQICANTPMEKEKCLAYNFNALEQKKYLQAFGLGLVELHPFFNYQGQYLRKVLR